MDLPREPRGAITGTPRKNHMEAPWTRHPSTMDPPRKNYENTVDPRLKNYGNTTNPCRFRGNDIMFPWCLLDSCMYPLGASVVEPWCFLRAPLMPRCVFRVPAAGQWW